MTTRDFDLETHIIKLGTIRKLLRNCDDMDTLHFVAGLAGKEIDALHTAYYRQEEPAPAKKIDAGENRPSQETTVH